MTTSAILLMILVIMIFAFTLYSMRNMQLMFQQVMLTKDTPSARDKEKEKEEEKEWKTNDDRDTELTPLGQGHIDDSYIQEQMKHRAFIHARDSAVLSNPLYPPLNRQPLHEYDTYRLLGYIVSEESREDTWHLYGRKKNNNQAEFYLRPSDRNTDLKIPLTNEIINTRHSRLRDIYTLPENLVIEHPLFQGHQYTVVEYPQHNFDSIYF